MAADGYGRDENFEESDQWGDAEDQLVLELVGGRTWPVDTRPLRAGLCVKKGREVVVCSRRRGN